MGSKPVRKLLTVVVDVLIVVAILLAFREFTIFFARIAHQGWAEAYNALTAKLVIPFGYRDVKTPYGGVFDIDIALTIMVVLVAEWVLSAVRDRA